MIDEKCAECAGKFNGSFAEFWTHRNSAKVPWNALSCEERKAYRAYVAGISRGLVMAEDGRSADIYRLGLWAEKHGIPALRQADKWWEGPYAGDAGQALAALPKEKA